MGGESDPGDAGDRVGDRALAAGVAAFIAAFLPVIGEFIAVPAALIGIALGLVGIRRFETGRTVRVVPAAVGTILSTGAVMVLVVVLVATHVRS